MDRLWADILGLENTPVMPGLVPGIHGIMGVADYAVDGRDKPGYDDL
jgi:hypothetical protein